MNINKYITPSSRNVATLISGTVISQFIAILVSPILTRIYSPDDYGVFGVYASIVGIVGVIITLKFDAAILLPKENGKAIRLKNLTQRIVLIGSLFSLLVLVIFKNQILTILNTPELGNWVLLTIISISSLGFLNLFNAMLNRYKDYKAIATSKISKTTGTTLSQLGIGFFNFGFVGLILGKVIGDIISLITSKILLNRNSVYSAEAKHTEYSSNWNKLVNEYQEFPKVTVPRALLNTMTSNFPIFILSAFFLSSVVGNFTQSLKVTYLPVTIIGASTYEVFSKKVTEVYNSGQSIYNISIKTAIRLSILGFIPFLTLTIFAPKIFAFVFGIEWYDAGRYTQLLAPYLYLVFITSPLAYLPILLDQQKKALIIDLVHLILRVFTLFIGVLFNKSDLAIGLLSLAGLMVVSYTLFWFLQIAKNIHNLND